MTGKEGKEGRGSDRGMKFFGGKKKKNIKGVELPGDREESRHRGGKGLKGKLTGKEGRKREWQGDSVWDGRDRRGN